MRLIDADRLLNKTIKLEAEARKQVVNYEPLDNPKKWHIWNGVLAERTAFKYDLMDAPTIDAEPVVRCKDCKWWNEDDNGLYGYCMAMKHTYISPNWEIGIYRTYKGDFYCADGERIEDEVKQDD